MSITMIEPAKKIIWNLLLMALGSVICCVAVNGILIPQKFFGAGFTGLSIVIYYLFDAVPVSILYFILNIPVFVLGWLYVGRRFFFYSIAGMLFFTAALQWTQVTIPIHDKILSSILAGIIMGVGSGTILRSLGSAGGLDILSVMLLKRFSIRIGTTILGFNSAILIAGAFLISLEGALYTLIYVYVNSFVVDFVVTGLSQRRTVLIISRHWEEISQEIRERLQRGVTHVSGRGGFSGEEIQLLYTVITFREVPRLKQIAKGIDPNVFMVVSDTVEVVGTRIGNQPHW
jgi:uncharacterized membrane-anchored protein YitT (DUF2179 family)